MPPLRCKNESATYFWLQNAGNVSYKYGFAAQEWIQYPGGLYKAASTEQFPASDTLSGALFQLNPGAMREMHWHDPNEWGNFVLHFIVSLEPLALSFCLYYLNSSYKLFWLWQVL